MQLFILVIEHSGNKSNWLSKFIWTIRQMYASNVHITEENCLKYIIHWVVGNSELAWLKGAVRYIYIYLMYV